MHPNNPQEFEFTLDDIIKEFSESSVDDLLREFAAEPEPEKVPDPVPVWEPVPARREAVAETVRMEPVVAEPVKQPVTQDTAVFTPVSQDASVFSPSAMPELVMKPESAPVSEPVCQAEPFSDEWEPEYEEPMGEYPQPIAFPSKNRQMELRKKLVAGPEKRYHKLAADGVGKLQVAMFIHLILLLASTACTVLHVLGLVAANQQRLLIFSQVVIAMVAGLVGCYRLLVGFGSVLRGRFTLNTLLAIAFIVCMVDGFFCLNAQRLPFTTVLCLDLLMAQWAEYQRRNTQIGQMDTLRKALEVTAVVKIPDYYEGKSGYVATEGDPDAFMEEYYKPTAPERRLEWFALVALVASVAVAVSVGLRNGWETAAQVLAAELLAVIPASSLIIVSRPIAILASRLYKLGAVLCGWKGMREADRLAVYPLEHDDLFPAECAKMNGVKFYGTVDPGRVVSYATALIAHDGKGMMRVFAHLPRSRNVQQHQVTDFLAYPGGISGLVDGWNVMVGTQEFLTGMGISVPEEDRIPQAVYAAVDGQFSAVFAVQYSRSKSSAAALRTLCGYRRVKAVLIASDFILTDQFIGDKLSVSVRRMVFPEREVRQCLAGTPVPEDAPVVALVTKSGLAPKAYALTGARALRATLNIGSIVHIFAGVLGLVAVGVLALTGSFHILTAQNLLGYGLVWLVPGLMISEWTRHI